MEGTAAQKETSTNASSVLLVYVVFVVPSTGAYIYVHWMERVADSRGATNKPVPALFRSRTRPFGLHTIRTLRERPGLVGDLAVPRSAKTGLNQEVSVYQK
jgi:hypothetical protein